MSPKSSKPQRQIHWSIARLLDQKGAHEEALKSVEKAMALGAQSKVDVLAMQTRLLFHLRDYQRGRAALLSTLACNNCNFIVARDLVEICCGLLAPPAVVATATATASAAPATPDRDSAIAIVTEAYNKLAERWPGEEQTLVAQLHTLTEHRMYQAALAHVDKSQKREQKHSMRK